MILKNTEDRLRKLYTVRNKNKYRMEKMGLPFAEYKYLYSGFYYPNGAKWYMRDWQYSPMKRLPYFNILNSVQLRDFQEDAINHVKNNAGGLIEAPTGSGKSFICIGITNLYKSKTLIVCPSKKLVKEMVDKFKEFTDYEPGTYYSDKKNIKGITITTTSSFVKDMTEGSQVLQGASVLIIDECDTFLSENFLKALCNYDCNVLVGMTGTARTQELDQWDLSLVYGPYISVGSYQMMPTSITQHIYNWMPNERSEIDYSNWSTLRNSMVRNSERFKKVANKISELKSNSFLTLLLLDRNEDVYQFGRYFPGALIITGTTKVKDDEKGIEQLRKKGGLIIGSLKKMHRGIDIPEIDNVIIASPVRFENTVIQSIGRALRKTDSKSKVDINIIDDSILESQRKEQAKVCKNIYNITPNIVHLNESYFYSSVGSERYSY